MRAMTITAFGEPDVLKLADFPKPQPGPEDLLIEVHAAALNPVDTKIRRGMHGDKPFPLVPGYDVSGVVVAMGSAVDRDLFKEGDEVYASPSLARPGAHAEFVAVDHRTAARRCSSTRAQAAWGTSACNWRRTPAAASSPPPRDLRR